MLHVPRVEHPDYPSCERLWTVSKDEMIFAFCKRPALEHLTIDFPSHFILSILDVYRDMATRDKLIFHSAITRIICHFSISIPDSDLFIVMGAISMVSVQ